MRGPRRGRLFPPPGGRSGEERFDQLVENDGLLVERIVSHGATSPPGFWYDQPRHEWVVVLSGSAGLRVEGEAEAWHLDPGDWVELPAGCRHRVEWTDAEEPTVWLAVHWGGP